MEFTKYDHSPGLFDIVPSENSELLSDNSSFFVFDTLNIITTVANVVSMLGSLLNIYMTYSLGLNQSILGKMVNHLGWVDFVFNFASIAITDISVSDTACQLLGIIELFTFGSSVGWTICFAYSLKESLKEGSVERLTSLYWRFIIFSYILGDIVATASYLTGFFGIDPSRDICSHLSRDLSFISTLCVLVIPLVLATIICVAYYVVAIKSIKSLANKTHWELLFYPLILVLCYCPYTTIISLKELRGYIPSATLLYLCEIVFNSQGLLNAIAYGLAKRCSCRSKKTDPLEDDISVMRSALSPAAGDSIIQFDASRRSYLS